MEDRVFAVIHDDPACAGNMAGLTQALGALGRVEVFAKKGFSAGGVAATEIPEGLDNEPKVRNWINGRLAAGAGFLHVVKDSVRPLPGLAAFVPELEAAMRALDYDVWLSTVVDRCNYVYGRYNPRVSVRMDTAHREALRLPAAVNFTSNSNTQWVAYNAKALVGSDLLRFDERFSVAMYFIIEFQARRRRTRKPGQLYYMNMYMSPSSEVGAFDEFQRDSSDRPDQKTMQEEGAVFREVCPDSAPDSDVDAALEALWEKIASKLGVDPAAFPKEG